MGIKNLKYLFKTIQSPGNPNGFQTMVVDGNNLIITFLYSAKTKVEKEHSVNDWQGFSFDIVQQTKYILLEAYKMIIKELNNFVEHYNLNDIWIVFDPTKNMRYNILLDKFNLIDKTYFDSLQHDDKNVISLNLKEDEHKKREQSRNLSKDKIHVAETYITNNEFYNSLGDIELVKELFKQSYGYNDMTLLHKLSRMLQKALTSKSRFSLGVNFKDEKEDYINLHANVNLKCKLYVVRAKDEADLVIKNICNDINIINTGLTKILVMSKDTDYKVLFADSPNVYITDLHCYSHVPLFHPYSAWREVLPEELTKGNIYDYVIRLAPIFGNDYTTGNSIINLSETADGKEQLQALLTFKNDNISKRSTLYKFIDSFSETDGIISTEELDTRIKTFMEPTYYVKYLQSIVIYKNFNYFCNFEITTKQFNFDQNLDFVYNNILQPAFKNIYTFNCTTDVKALVSTSKKLEDFKTAFYEEPVAFPTDEYFSCFDY